MIHYFASSNTQKWDDVTRVFDRSERVRRLDVALLEVLSPELREVVREKARVAYQQALVPLFVEHGALEIEYLNRLPGPMVKLVWEKLGGRLCEIIPASATRRARVVQMVCYCDGRRFQIFTGQIEGEIAREQRGVHGIHWEPTFIPAGHAKTLGEMDPDERIEAHATTPAYRELRRELGI